MSNTVLVYDDDCGFCTRWAEFFDDRTDIRIVGFSELSSDLRERLPAEYEECSHFVTDETVYSCGASVEQVLLRTGPGSVARPLVEVLRSFDVYRTAREWSYRQGANNRAFLGRLLSKMLATRRTDGGKTDAK